MTKTISALVLTCCLGSYASAQTMAHVASSDSSTTATASAQTLAIHPGATVAVGQLAIVGCMRVNPGDVLASVTDDAGGNTWTVDVDGSVNDQDSTHFGVAHAVLATQLTAASNVTCTWTNGSAFNYFAAVFMAATNPAASPKDKTGAAATSATSIASASTGTLTQADEFIFCLGAVHDGARTLTAGTSFTIGTQFQFAGPPETIGTQYWSVNATTATTCPMTWDGGGTKDEWGVAVTFKAASASGRKAPSCLLGSICG